MIPARLLIQSVTVVEPVVDSDDYRNDTYDHGPAATRTVIPARLQQDRHTERYTDGRSAAEELWSLYCNHEGIQAIDRIEWPATGLTFELFGEPKPTYDGKGYHHTEATLRVLEG